MSVQIETPQGTWPDGINEKQLQADYKSKGLVCKFTQYGETRKFLVLMMANEDVWDAERALKKLPGVHPNARLDPEILNGRVFTATDKFFESMYRTLPETRYVSDDVKEQIYLKLHEKFGGHQRKIGI
jgi:hypothetical protein